MSNKDPYKFDLSFATKNKCPWENILILV